MAEKCVNEQGRRCGWNRVAGCYVATGPCRFVDALAVPRKQTELNVTADSTARHADDSQYSRSFKTRRQPASIPFLNISAFPSHIFTFGTRWFEATKDRQRRQWSVQTQTAHPASRSLSACARLLSERQRNWSGQTTILFFLVMDHSRLCQRHC